MSTPIPTVYSPDNTTLRDCVCVVEDGRFYVRDSAGREAYSEHGGGHLHTAWAFLTMDRAEANWKTVGILKALRQAFREDSANCHDEARELIEHGPSQHRVRIYLQGARARDCAHHGQHTF